MALTIREGLHDENGAWLIVSAKAGEVGEVAVGTKAVVGVVRARLEVASWCHDTHSREHGAESATALSRIRRRSDGRGGDIRLTPSAREEPLELVGARARGARLVQLCW